jgi:hypothetical protein
VTKVTSLGSAMAAVMMTNAAPPTGVLRGHALRAA